MKSEYTFLFFLINMFFAQIITPILQFGNLKLMRILLVASGSSANDLSDFKACALLFYRVAPGSPHTLKVSFCPLLSTCDKFCLLSE